MQEWLAWSISGYAPMLGQWNYFANRAKEKTPAAINRFTTEAARLFSVLEARLSQATYLAHDFSIADISTYTWAAAVLHPFRDASPGVLAPTPHIERWMAEIAARPAVQRGMRVPEV